MDRRQWENVFNKVQRSTAAHQKCIRILVEWFKKSSIDDFAAQFTSFLTINFFQKPESAVYVKRVSAFASRFCVEISRTENENQEFLALVVKTTLKLSRNAKLDVRCNSCHFLAKLLQDIGEDLQLEIELIDEIQRVMLERVQETKVTIRLQAISALVRLQEPTNLDCPVVTAYVEALSSTNPNVRREATRCIAPNIQNISKIIERIRDVNSSVRSVAFHKCADIGPIPFKISEKHTILSCGFMEGDEKVRGAFYDYLLPKWLTAYGGKFLDFVKAVKLIADDEDLLKVTWLSKNLIKDFFIKNPTDDLLTALPINDEFVIDIQNLSAEVTLLWRIVVQLLRETEDGDERLNRIVPELTPFCGYIESIVKAKSVEMMDEWKHFEYQFDLLNILEILEHYDFSDEVGRRTTHSLAINLLQKYRFVTRVTKKIVSVAQKSGSDEFLTNDMCQVISHLQEKTIERPLSQNEEQERKFRIAELKVQINILQEEQSNAVSTRDYQKAHLLNKDLATAAKSLEELQTQVETIVVRQTDDEALCRCLDVLGGVLELSAVSKLTPSLITCRDNFLIPLIKSQSDEVHWRMLNCLSLMALIDRTTAEQYGKIISIPIATYRTIPINNVPALVQSIMGTADLICFCGVDIVGDQDKCNNDQNSTRRHLYNRDDDMATAKNDNVTLISVIEIYLDMLDDERDAVRYKAMDALVNILRCSATVTPSVLSRVILKWSSPLTEKYDCGLQVRLGRLIEIVMKFRNIDETLRACVVPTLSSIANAPRTSPLADIDVDNVLMFLAEMVNIHLSKDDLRIFVLDLCMKISDSPTERVIPLLARFLGHLDVNQQTNMAMAEMIDRAELLKENLSERVARNHVDKFVTKLRISLANSTAVANETVESINTSHVQRLSLHNSVPAEKNELQQTKRRKRRVSKDCYVMLERFAETRKSGTILKPGSELSRMEQIVEIDDNMDIETPTTSSEDSSKWASRSNLVVVSETSDSDNGSDRTRTTRSRKKRIL